jgi:phosphate-selective porin
MSLRKHLIVLSLSAASFGLVLAPALQAAFVTAPPADADSLAMTIATKSKPKAKTAKAKPQKTCGTNMYFSKKDNKCMDARAKKAS